MDPMVYSPRTYYVAVTDKLSEQKAKVGDCVTCALMSSDVIKGCRRRSWWRRVLCGEGAKGKRG